MTSAPKLVGILNVTPDSFSDGGQYQSVEAATSHIKKMIADGAALIDIGADSTRPGSVCVGEVEEWRRLQPILESLSSSAESLMPRVSIDTHILSTAQRAIAMGVRSINDVSGGSPGMFELVARENCKIIIMHSRCKVPHDFSKKLERPVIDSIRRFFDRQIQTAERVGLPRSQLLFDPGMGGFLSTDYAVSIELIKNIHKLEDYFPLYIGVSRKKFLHHLTAAVLPVNLEGENIDEQSALVMQYLIKHISTEKLSQLFFRVHDVSTHHRYI